MSFRIVAISLAIVFFVIGVHQTIMFGLYNSYWAFSLSGLFFLLYVYLQRKHNINKVASEAGEQEMPQPNPRSSKHRAQKKKKRKNR